MLCRLLFGHHGCLALSMFSLIPAFVITGIMDKWVMKGKSAMDRMALARNDADLRYVPRDYDRAEDGYADVYVHRAGSLDLLSDVLRGRSAKIGFRDAAGVEFLAPFTKGPVGLLMPPLSIAVFLAVKRDWKGLASTWVSRLGHHRRACGPLDRLCLD